MRKILLTMIALFAIAGFAQQAPQQIVKTLGYCTDKIDTGVGTGKAGVNLRAAITYPSSTMTQYTGSHITKIFVGLVEGTGINNFKVWIASAKDGQRIIEQEVNPGDDWNEVFLDNPYEITGQDIWIGYDATSSEAAKYPLGISKNTMNENGNWIYNGSNWSQLSASVGGNWCIRASVDDGQYEIYDVALTSLNIQNGVQTFKPFDIKGTIKNNGHQAINSFEVTYVINGGEPVVNTISGVEVLLGRSYEFTCPIKGIIKTLGSDNTINVYISYFNEQNDDATPNDNSLTKSNIISYKQFYPRKTVLEHFTTEKCPNCPQGHETIKNVVSDNPDVIWVCHHSGYYEDKFTTQMDKDMLWFYQSGSTFAPAVMLDRLYISGSQYSAPVQGVPYLTKTLLSNRIATPAFVGVDITGSYDSESRAIKVAPTVNFAADIEEKTTITVLLLENGIQSSTQSNGGSNYIHNHVIRECLTASFGDIIRNTNAGDKFSQEFTFTIPSTWNADNMDVVAFVSKKTDDKKDCEVFNGSKIAMKDMIGGRYKVNVDGDCNEKGVNFILSGEGVYTPNSEVTLTAAAESDEYIVKFLGWYLDDMEMSTDPTYTFMSGELNLDYVAKFKAEKVSIDNNESLNIAIYPNPAKNTITIDGDYDALQIMNVAGRMVKAIDNPSTSIDISDLSKGVYLIKVHSGNLSKIVKLIKQ